MSGDYLHKVLIYVTTYNSFSPRGRISPGRRSRA